MPVDWSYWASICKEEEDEEDEEEEQKEERKKEKKALTCLWWSTSPIPLPSQPTTTAPTTPDLYTLPLRCISWPGREGDSRHFPFLPLIYQHYYITLAPETRRASFGSRARLD